MNDNTLIIMASARKDGDTNRLISSIFDQNESTESVHLLDYKIEYYNYEGHYSKADQFNLLIKKIINNQNIILVTPVYWHSMSSLMKTFIERLNDLLVIDKPTGRLLKGKQLVLVTLGTSDNLPEKFTSPFFYLSNYLEMEYKGYFYFKTNAPINKEELDCIKKFLEK